ncbi:hypothetical protein G7Y79_00009g027200 [Physcia stellaris]|nr:hypothetical protein G7Y79_00009g027200 [Physcia stellaris]
MSSEVKKQKALEHMPEDELDRVEFGITPTSRRKQRKYSASTMSIKRQETLTQIGWGSSPRLDDEDNDLQYERLPNKIPPKVTKNKSRQGRRKRFPKQKETLTQMPFISLIPYEHDDLESDDGKTENFPQLPPPTRKRKRPKAVKEESLARVVQTRSVKKHAAEKGRSLLAHNENENPSGSPLIEPRQPQGQPNSMLPPKTPRVSRQKEIPSSQSPPETPLSMQSKESLGTQNRSLLETPLSMRSRKSLETQTRSPLKDVSPNIRAAAKGVPNRLLFPAKLEIADTMDSDGDESQVPGANGVSKEGSQIYLPPSMRLLTQPDLEDLNSQLHAHSPMASGPGRVSARRVKSEIFDSDDNDDEEGDEEEELEQNDFATEDNTQTAREITACSSLSHIKKETQKLPDTSQNPPSLGKDALEDVAGTSRESGSLGCKITDQQLTPRSEILKASPRTSWRRSGEVESSEAEVSQPSEPTTSPVKQSPGRDSRAASELSIPDMEFPASHPSSPEAAPSHYSDSSITKHGASRDLDSSPPPTVDTEIIPTTLTYPPRLAPETESQFDDAWRSYSPPPRLSPISSSPNHISPDEPSTPTLAKPSPYLQPPSDTAPIPPSQATTVDITQRTQPQLPLPLPTPLDFPTSATQPRKPRGSVNYRCRYLHLHLLRLPCLL